jgi:hypothetical protein
VWLVEIGYESTGRNVLRHERHGIRFQLRQYPLDLRVGQVLEHLSDEAEIADRKLVSRDVEATESNALRPELPSIALDQLGNDVHSFVTDPQLRDRSPDPEVATAEIHDRPDPARPDEMSYVF